MIDTPITVSGSAAGVERRYDELTAILEAWRSAPPTFGAADRVARRERAGDFVIGEARLLDDRRDTDWLSLWHPDGLLWVPLDAESTPGGDQAYFLDDVRRLGERLRWRRQPSAWSQDPAARTVRAVSNVEAHSVTSTPSPGSPSVDTILVRSVIVLHEFRHGRTHTWAGHQFHQLVATDGELRIRAKILVVPALAGPVTHPGALL